jgi:flavin-dependent dehydrogenase
MVSQKLNAKESASDYEVMIIGGGPAGISTWMHLQKYAPQLADRSLVIEKAVFPRDKVCAGAVGSWSKDVLEHLEIELDIPSLFVSDVEFKYGKEIYHLYQPNSFRIVQRMDFDHALAKIAVNRGLELHEGEMLIDLARDQNQLFVKTNKKIYRVQALVGADGALSRVRKKMISTHKPHFAPTIQIFAMVDPRYDIEFNEKKIVFDLTPINKGLQGFVFHFPCLRDGAPSMAHGIGDFRIFPDKPRADMKKIFSSELQSRNIHAEPKYWSSHPICWFSGEEIVSKPNILLAGDAAGIEPAFGGGIHIAFSYGEVAARTIIDAFQKNDFSFHDYKQKVQSHFMGRYIQDCTHAAMEMYSGRVNPLNVVRKLLPERNESPDPVSLMISEVAKTLHTS